MYCSSNINEFPFWIIFIVKLLLNELDIIYYYFLLISREQMLKAYDISSTFMLSQFRADGFLTFDLCLSVWLFRQRNFLPSYTIYLIPLSWLSTYHITYRKIQILEHDDAWLHIMLILKYKYVSDFVLKKIPSVCLFSLRNDLFFTFTSLDTLFVDFLKEVDHDGNV